MKKFKTGLVLSGGGVRGIAHAGALKALDELGVKIECISGTSSGALIGVLYSAGVKPDYMIDFVKRYKMFDLSGVSLSFESVLSNRAFHTIIKDHIPFDLLEELPIPVSVCCTDFTNGKQVHFTSGSVINVVTASCAVPFIFPSVSIEGIEYVDGGLFDNFPVESIRSECKRVIGVHVNPLSLYSRSGFKKKFERTFQMAISSSARFYKGNCDLFIEPEGLNAFSVFDTKHPEKIFALGYDEIMKNKSVFEEWKNN